jgi:hypothetical protein
MIGNSIDLVSLAGIMTSGLTNCQVSEYACPPRPLKFYGYLIHQFFTHVSEDIYG